jgi:hypothetical protein
MSSIVTDKHLATIDVLYKKIPSFNHYLVKE